MQTEMPQPGYVLALCELRHRLLLTLGRLHQPGYALERLAEFKQDVITVGVDATIAKWTDFIDQAEIGLKLLGK